MDSTGQPVQIAPSAALHQKADKYESLATQVLELLNRPNNRDEVIKEILFRVQAVSGIQAVGIRLQEGEDFPYGEALGFSKDFVAAENSLCARDQTGEILRDTAGKPVLECLCGTVLRGSTDPSRPFFTNGGSFWTNSTTAFLATAAGKNRPSRARMRCNGKGYESVALIPLRSDHKIVGLLQLNDPQKNFFTASLIRFFESISSSIGFFLKIRQAEETLLQFLQGRPPLPSPLSLLLLIPSIIKIFTSSRPYLSGKKISRKSRPILTNSEKEASPTSGAILTPTLKRSSPWPARCASSK